MSKNDTNSEATGEPKKKRVLPQAFTPMNARQAQEASVRARNMRKAMRVQLLEAAINDAKVGELFVKAFKTRDMDLMRLVETGMKIVGLTHDQSEEVVNKIQLDANVDAKTETTIKTVKFVLDKPCPEQQNS